MSKIISLEQAAKLIKDHDIVATTASSGLAGLPEELIVGIGNRYKEEESPKNITFINGSGIGLNSEGRGMDHIAHEGLVKRVISGHIGFSHRCQDLLRKERWKDTFIRKGLSPSFGGQ